MRNLRWLWFDYSNPRLPISRRTRAELGARMKVRARHTRPWHLLPIFVAFLAAYLLDRAHGSPWLLVPLAAATWIACAWVGRWTLRRPLRLAERDLDLETCAHCGHWLKGLPVSTRSCPECGRPRVGVSPFRPAARRAVKRKGLADRPAL
jgi:hypothetical protein